jgi:heme-degrading monooxygenase HmoA
MFGRQVTMRLKANSAPELTRINDKEILPVLRKHKGFRDETIFISPERSEAIVNTFWDSKEDAEAYSRTGYAEVMKKISNLVEGTPTIKTFELASSTFHQRAAANAA